MSELQKELIKNGIHYTLHGDYYYPDLITQDINQPVLGKYGLMHAEHLRKDHPILFDQLLLSGNLMSMLQELDQQTHERLEIIIRQFAEAEKVNETLKASDQMEWVRRMNSIRNFAEEIVLNEMIFA